MLEASAGAEGSETDAADDVGGERVAGEVIDERAGARVVGGDDGAEEGLDLVQAALEGEDVALGRAAFVAGPGVGARWRGGDEGGGERVCVRDERKVEWGTYGYRGSRRRDTCGRRRRARTCSWCGGIGRRLSWVSGGKG